MDVFFSFIVPVYNRPQEVGELLHSLAQQTYAEPFEVVVVEDGSTQTSAAVVREYAQRLTISYHQKLNSGPGSSRNYGMERARGNYFIILDSDCILPPHYLSAVQRALEEDFVHCFGGPDAAHASFTPVQKAINYAMTSLFTTGGIRGGKKSVNRFQPRSFNMGISKEAFGKVGGYGNIHPGEDPDLTIRIWKEGYGTRLFPEAYVYHKRRIDWNKFYVQVNKFGMVRPILNQWHPHTASVVYWFPTVFLLGLVLALVLPLLGLWWPILGYGAYFMLLLADALIKTRSLRVSLMALWATLVQFFGYGLGFLKSYLYLKLGQKNAEQRFPNLFFDSKGQMR
ncbi:glycosyltransferase [Maribacter sp. 2307ULW6-5]|uniref:glycosyltransferase n=1 Tax=Maribacter sp. 2307ULW6-5 TaxID=3386275 RepID=UPI0039BCEB85